MRLQQAIISLRCGEELESSPDSLRDAFATGALRFVEEVPGYFHCDFAGCTPGNILPYEVPALSMVSLSKEHSQDWLCHLAEVAPVVEFVGVFDPAVADVGAVVHVGDHYVFDAGIDLGLGLQHGLAGADYDQDNSAGAGD